MKNLLPIGRFSRVARLSVKMLRHYDGLGLLKPALVDDSSGYRYYSLAQIAEAERIRLLRELELPLEEIRSLLLEPNEDRARQVLAQHRNRLQSQISQHQRSLDILALLESQPSIEPYRVMQKSLEAQPVLRLRLRATFATFAQVIGPGYERLYAHLGRAGERPTGSAYSSMGEDFDEEFDLEIGVPTERLLQGRDDLEAGVLPGGMAVSTLHAGGFERITGAYQALIVWIQEHGHETSGDPLEHYLVGPGQTSDPKSYRTEIVWPIKAEPG
jgi:DNA-binding transcriptional MerR regulator